jgi:H/ACA ribonucleoprotein complex subunit 2
VASSELSFSLAHTHVIFLVLEQGEKGICTIAGDISPIDVISHVPIFCEQKDVAYIYVPSKQDLGAAANTKRPTSVVLIQCKKGFEEKELFDKTLGEVQKAMPDFK